MAVHEFEPGNHGFVATHDIEKGQLLVFVPRGLFITADEAQESQTVQDLWEMQSMLRGL